jgi:hypothetical protein
MNEDGKAKAIGYIATVSFEKIYTDSHTDDWI